MPGILEASAEADQTTLFGGLSKSMNGGKPVLHSQVGEIRALTKERRAAPKDQYGPAVARQRGDLGLEATLTRPRKDRQIKAKRFGCSLGLADFKVVRRIIGRIGNKNDKVRRRDQFPRNFNSLCDPG